MIKNIVFDLGNVLLSFKPVEYLKERFNDSKLVDEFYNLVFKSPEWLMLDRGIITEEDAIKKFCCQAQDKEKIIRELMTNWYKLLIPIDDTIRIFKELKYEGYNLYILSNFHLRAFEIVYDLYDFFALADGITISSKVNYLKPEVEIYEKLINCYNLKPEESLFIDDIAENIKGATLCGMDVIHFKTSKELRSELVLKGLLNN